MLFFFFCYFLRFLEITTLLLFFPCLCAEDLGQGSRLQSLQIQFSPEMKDWSSSQLRKTCPKKQKQERKPKASKIKVVEKISLMSLLLACIWVGKVMREESFCQFWSFLSFSFTQICLQLLQDHQIKWGLKIWSKVLLCHSVILLIPSVQEF